jgi:hypothetical protein
MIWSNSNVHYAHDSFNESLCPAHVPVLLGPAAETSETFTIPFPLALAVQREYAFLSFPGQGHLFLRDSGKSGLRLTV